VHLVGVEPGLGSKLMQGIAGEDGFGLGEVGAEEQRE
jgi:hypothetical protein